ncbi:MAG: DUF1501 domain-containing protein [Nocardioidaceae bacterium]|nr:DUF1501 domain-containing protein [Nocardioidaceae bacterium]
MDDCCEEYAGLSRRGLLRGALGVAGVSAATSMFGATFLQTAYGATRPVPRVLVLLSLRGAADGLSLVVPHGDPAYYAARPRIAVPAANLLAKDAFFGLHPRLAPLLPLWNAGKVAAIHATGQPVVNRSHFDAMEKLEDANPGSSQRVGWINRLVGRDGYHHPLQAVGFGMSSPIGALYGPEPTVTATSMDAIALSGADARGRRTSSIRTLWGTAGGPLGSGARSALATIADFAPAKRVPARGGYANDDLGSALSSAARTIKANIGAEVIAVDHDGGWDMHTDLGTLDRGRMIGAAGSLATSLAAFFADLGTWASRVTVVTVSEFGRRVKENGNQGLDHGYGNVMLVLGAGVKGGYYGSWPGLTNSLDADLPVTTDYRSVLAEVVSKRLGASTAQVFPGFAPEPVGAVLST